MFPRKSLALVGKVGNHLIHFHGEKYIFPDYFTHKSIVTNTLIRIHYSVELRLNAQLMVFFINKNDQQVFHYAFQLSMVIIV